MKQKININYHKELVKLQRELVKLQYWVQKKGLKVVVLFEGRDGAGKGSTIKNASNQVDISIPTVKRYVGTLPRQC